MVRDALHAVATAVRNAPRPLLFTSRAFALHMRQVRLLEAVQRVQRQARRCLEAALRFARQ